MLGIFEHRRRGTCKLGVHRHKYAFVYGTLNNRQQIREVCFRYLHSACDHQQQKRRPESTQFEEENRRNTPNAQIACLLKVDGKVQPLGNSSNTPSPFDPCRLCSSCTRFPAHCRRRSQPFVVFPRATFSSKCGGGRKDAQLHCDRGRKVRFSSHTISPFSFSFCLITILYDLSFVVSFALMGSIMPRKKGK